MEAACEYKRELPTPNIAWVDDGKLMRWPPRTRRVYVVHKNRQRGRPSPNSAMYMNAYWDARDGYGYSATMLALELLKRRWKLSLIGQLDCTAHAVENSPHPELRARKHKRVKADKALTFTMPWEFTGTPLVPFSMVFTMWEASHTPLDWPLLINQHDLLITPST